VTSPTTNKEPLKKDSPEIEDPKKNSVIWNDFNKRFIELIKERFNLDSVRVKKLLNQAENDEIIIKSLLILSFCISNQGYQKLKNFLYDF